MIDCKFAEEILNQEARKILLLIKKDYYNYMSEEIQAVIDDLIRNANIVVVNDSLCISNINIFAHSGRHLKDGKIHFYPKSRNFKTAEEFIERAKEVLTHELFHYLIQPDKYITDRKLLKEIAEFYVEGLVEKESRKFFEVHKTEILFRKANYECNIDFVNMIQSKLQADTYEVIFSQSDYLKNIYNYVNEYNQIKQKTKVKKENGIESVINEGR